MSRPAAVETVAMTRAFGSVVALDRLDLRVEHGEFVAIMGPSGSGKTTLLNILSCLDSPSGGQCIIDGIDTSGLSEAERVLVRRDKIGMVFQQFHLIPYLTAIENVMLAQYYHSVPDRDEARAGLERVGLGKRLDHLPSQLSGGEQQRVCIVRALVNDPALLLADEPTGNLDVENEALVVSLLDQVHHDGRTILMVTHNPALAERASRVVTLEHGKLRSDVRHGAGQPALAPVLD